MTTEKDTILAKIAEGIEKAKALGDKQTLKSLTQTFEWIEADLT